MFAYGMRCGSLCNDNTKGINVIHATLPVLAKFRSGACKHFTCFSCEDKCTCIQGIERVCSDYFASGRRQRYRCREAKIRVCREDDVHARPALGTIEVQRSKYLFVDCVHRCQVGDYRRDRRRPSGLEGGLTIGATIVVFGNVPEPR